MHGDACRTGTTSTVAQWGTFLTRCLFVLTALRVPMSERARAGVQSLGRSGACGIFPNVPNGGQGVGSLRGVGSGNYGRQHDEQCRQDNRGAVWRDPYTLRMNTAEFVNQLYHPAKFCEANLAL